MTDHRWSDHKARMRDEPSLDGLGRMAEALESGTKIVRVQPLRGGIITSVHAVEVRTPGGATRRFVLKRYLCSADDAKREWAALQLAQRVPVEVPEPVLLAETGEWFEDAALVTTLLPGRTRIPFEPGQLPERLGETLAAIHASDVGGCVPVGVERFWYGSWKGSDAFLSEVYEAVEGGLSSIDLGVSALLHCDFWIGNVLWRDRRVSGVVDWSNCCVGPRGRDVGYARVDIELIWGWDAARRFTDAYSCIAGPVPDLPVWDLICGSDALEGAVWWMRGYNAVGRNDIALEQVQARLTALLRRALEQT
jgi:aminoglycoside phosphotransferase (APT) family kinase protein